MFSTHTSPDFSESFAEHFGRTKEQPTPSLEICQILENSWDFISCLQAFLNKVELKDVVKVQQVTECFIESGLWSTTNLSQLRRETEDLSCCLVVSKVKNAKAKYIKGNAADTLSLMYFKS